MESGIVLVVLVILGIPILLAIWLIIRALSARNRIEELSVRLANLESKITRLTRTAESPNPVGPKLTPVPEPIIAITPSVAPPQSTPTPPPIFSQSSPSVATPPIPVETESLEALTEDKSPPPPAPKINWEQFMGVKGFAWLGGFALFLGVAFFVKYSFDNNFLPPELRVAIGFLTGLGLLVGGMLMSRKDFPALSQTLCATGVVILYAVTFACRSIYHFEFFGALPTFLLMALITTTAFYLAVRLNALVVAILGMLGGFLTPVLLSTGPDNPLGLFGYIAILDAGLMVVALNRRWYFLTALAAAGTAIMQVGWLNKFFVAEKYFEGDRIFIALAVLLGFNALWLAASWLAKRRDQINQWLSGSTLGLVAVTLASTAWFLDFAPLAQRPWLVFSFVFLVDLIAVAVTLIDPKTSPAKSVSGFAVYGLLAFWTANSLSNELLNAALAFYFIFAVAVGVIGHSVSTAVSRTYTVFIAKDCCTDHSPTLN